MESDTPTGNQEHPPIPPQWGLRCCHCEYELTGLTIHRCPECGKPFDVDETMRINRRSTWEYLLENRCTPFTYPIYALLKRLGVSAQTIERIDSWSDRVFYGLLTVSGIGFILLALAEPWVLVALVLWVPAEMIIAVTERGRGWFRLIVWTICFLWALLICVL